MVDLYGTGNYSIPQLESEYGVSRSTLSGWIRQLSPIKISKNERVQRHMKLLGIRSVVVKKYNHKTNITYIHVLKEGFHTLHRLWTSMTERLLVMHMEKI